MKRNRNFLYIHNMYLKKWLVEEKQHNYNFKKNPSRILATGRSQCHLKVLEAVFIKYLSPCMSLQKEHVKKLMLFR